MLIWFYWTDITDIESQLKEIKKLAIQSPGFSYGPGQAMYEYKTRAEGMVSDMHDTVMVCNVELVYVIHC